MNLVNDIQDLNRLLSNSINLLAKYGREYAEAEMNYKIALNQECLKLRDGGMAVTLIDKVVYGVKEVAEKRFKRDSAEIMWKTAQENVNVLKIRIKILENQLNREWSNENR